MINPVKVRGVTVGRGIPKICVPITGGTKEEIIRQSEKTAVEAPDLVEWRFDYYGSCFDQEAKDILVDMRGIFRHIPIIFTFRTREEGGVRQISTQNYRNLLQDVAKHPEIDLIDVELERADQTLIDQLHAAGKQLILSRHYFDGTPSVDEMEIVFRRMNEKNADILKLAVMPADIADVRRLMEVTHKISSQYRQPVVTMSMGDTGLISRICGEATGSSITFGAVGEVSAPGQISACELRKLLILLHDPEK